MSLVRTIYRNRFFGVPILFICICWIVKIIESIHGISFSSFGIIPKSFSGLDGILFSPLLHGDWEHLLNNTFSFFVLSALLFNVYPGKALQIFLWMWFLSGFWLWAVGRPLVHIGASGLIYALASFHFFSGFITRNKGQVVISLLVVFLYGYLIWGVLPVDPSISFEGHFTGALAGLVLAWFFRKDGPRKIKHEWPEEELPDPEDPYWVVDPKTDEKTLQ